jgi:DNA polymerase-3 subunit delta'
MIYPWQQSQWQQINQLVKAGSLPHALLLLGNQGLGKTDFANSLAHSLLCQHPSDNLEACGQCKSCNLLAAETHPDLYHIQPAPPPNSTSKNPVLSIKIDEIRELCEKLEKTSQMGGYRVAVIEQADYLTISAANSLLKTLEEPGDDILILLVSARPYRLPVTIRSRCQVLRFSVPDQSLSIDWLQQTQSNYQVEQFRHALKMTHGSPLAAVSLMEQSEHRQLLEDAMTAMVSGKNSLEYAEKLAKFPKLQTLEGMLAWTSDLGKILVVGSDADIINEHARAKLQALATRTDRRRLFRFYDQLNFNILHSAISVNEQLLWENLLLSWENL